MQGKSYRLSISTLAIITCEDQKVFATIPPGAIVILPQADINDSHLVDVIWEGRSAMMFAEDVRSRGELVMGVGV